MKQQTFSYAKLGWRLLIWSSIGLLGYNWYLNNYKVDAKNELGYVKEFS